MYKQTLTTKTHIESQAEEIISIDSDKVDLVFLGPSGPCQALGQYYTFCQHLIKEKSPIRFIIKTMS